MKEYIERAKLMDHIELNAREHEEDYDAWQILGDVEDFPAADVVERKRGEWKNYGRNLGECSNCGEIVAVRYKFCPNCGADMRSHQNILCDQTEKGE